MRKTVLFKVLLVSAIACLSIDLLAQNTDAQAAQHQAENHALTDRYPTQNILRPGIMPTGIFAVDTTGSMNSKQEVNLKFATEFGIVNHLQGEFSYDGFDFNKFEAKDKFGAQKTVNLGAKYNYFSVPHISASVSGNVPIHFDDHIIRNFSIGLPLTFYNDLMAGSVLGGELFDLTMRPHVAMAFNFKYWYGIQVYGDFWAKLDGSFGELKMPNEKGQAQKWEGTGFWQKLPLNLSALYAFNHYVDLGANFGVKDALNAKETYNFGLTLSVRGGRIFG